MMWWTYDAGSVSAEKYPNASKVRLVLARGLNGHGIAIIPEAHMARSFCKAHPDVPRITTFTLGETRCSI